MNQNKILQSITSMKVTNKININNCQYNNKNNLNLNVSLFQQLSLDKYLDINKQIMLGQVIRLVYIESNGEIHIDEEGLQILHGFSKYQIGFVGIYGQRQAGKSLFYDNVIKLSGVQGQNLFRKQYHNQLGKLNSNHNYNHNHKYKQKQKGIYFYTIPFRNINNDNINNDIKIFLLDCVGFEPRPASLTVQQARQQNMLLDFLLILSSSIILLPSADDKKGEVFNLIHKKLQQSICRITQNDNKSTNSKAYWPQNLYCLYRNKSLINMNNDNLQGMFTYFNYTVIYDAFVSQKKQNMIPVNLGNIIKTYQTNNYMNVLYLKQMSRLMKEIFNGIYVKKYYQLTMNGNICCKLMLEIVRNFNQQENFNIQNYHSNNQNNKVKNIHIIPIDKIYLSIVHELYQLSYQYHTQLYSQNIQSYLTDDHAYSLNYLIDAFDKSQSQAFNSFRQLIINPKLNQQYQQKLNQYIEQKQKYILEINKKKSKYQLKNIIKQEIKFPEQFQNNQQISQVLHNIKNLSTGLDHDRCQAFVRPLSDFSDVLSKKYFESLKKKEQQKISQIKQRISLRKSILGKAVSESMRNISLNNQNQQRLSTLKNIDISLNQKLKLSKKQGQIQKKSQKQFLSNKQATQSHAQQLLGFIRQLQEKQRENEKKITQINKDFEYNPKVQILNKKIQENKRQQKIYESSIIGKSQKYKLSQIRPIGTGITNSSYIPSSKYK